MNNKKYRTKMKRQVISYLLNMNADNQEQYIEKNELSLRLLKFFEYEQDPDFEKLFNNFINQKRKKININKKGEER